MAPLANALSAKSTMSYPAWYIPPDLKAAADAEVAAFCAQKTACNSDAGFRYRRRWEGGRCTVIELSQRQGEPPAEIEAPFVEFRWRMAEGGWSLHHWWRDNKWGRYRMPGGAGQPLATILEEIERDPHGYFWTKEARSWRLLPKPISPIIQDFVTCLLDEYCQDPGSQGGRRLSYFWRRNRVTLIEHKPTLNPMEWAEVPFVQFLYDPAAGTWTLFSADRKGRWRTYEGVPCGSDIQTLLAVVDEDPTGSIWIERTPRRHPCGSHLTWTRGKWIATNSLPFPSQVPSEG